MITENHVNLETAKLLKGKRYKGPFDGYYNDAGCVIDIPSVLLKEPKYQYYERVSLYMALKWLEKEKHIAIIPVLSSILDDEKFLWDVKIVVAETGETYSQGWVYEDIESAYEAAIKYCLENLI